jgi:hypothetical protein
VFTFSGFRLPLSQISVFGPDGRTACFLVWLAREKVDVLDLLEVFDSTRRCSDAKSQLDGQFSFLEIAPRNSNVSL